MSEHGLDLTTPCEVHDGNFTNGGYPQGKKTTAHREKYMEVYGPVPRDIDIMHMCHNRACVNVKHLKPGTRAENLRMRTSEAAGAGGRAIRGITRSPEYKRKLSALRYREQRSCECGLTTNHGALARHQKATGHVTVT